MKRILLFVVTAASLVVTPVVIAQGHGAHGGGGQAGMGRPQMQGTQAGRGQMGNSDGYGMGDRDTVRQRDRMHATDRQRDRIHATDRQRDQVRDCINSADRTRTQARDMQKLTKNSKFNQQAALQQRDRLQQHLRTMEQSHERLMQGFSPDQRNTAQERIRTMEQTREQANRRMREMNNELAQTNPNRGRLQQQARELERDMQQWRDHYRQMSSDMEP